MKRFCIAVVLIAFFGGCERQADSPPPPGQAAKGREPSADLTPATAGEAKESADGIEALVLAIESGDVTAVVTAADAVESMGAKGAGAAPALVSRLDDPQPWVREACMDALGAVGEPAVAALLEAFQTGTGGAPVRAAIVLGEIGPAARAAAPQLRKALDEGPQGWRSWIEEALAKIEGGNAPAGSGEPHRGGRVAFPSERPAADGSDWPQFHGPRRDNLCLETGLNTDWSRETPELLWKIEGLGMGYSSVAVTGGRIFTMGDRKRADGAEVQFVLAFDAGTQEELWAAEVGPAHEDGPRCTPTVDGPLVYAVGTEGDLVCVEAANGAERWRVSMVEDFGGQMMSRWKFSESPLVDGDQVICTPGGPEAMVVALDKTTGETIWKCKAPALGQNGKDGAGYASPVVAEIDGVRQYIQLVGRGLVSVEAETGRFLWGYNDIANGTANIPTPIVRGRYVFATTSYNSGSVLLEISQVGDAFHVREVYRLSGRQFENHHGGIVCVDGAVYGGHGNSRGEPVCIDAATGQVRWRGKAPERGSAAVLWAEGHLVLRYDRGLVALVEATPEAYRLKGSFQPVAGAGPAWAHPVIVDGRLYLRHADLLACYDLRAR